MIKDLLSREHTYILYWLSFFWLVYTDHLYSRIAFSDMKGQRDSGWFGRGGVIYIYMYR